MVSLPTSHLARRFGEVKGKEHITLTVLTANLKAVKTAAGLHDELLGTSLKRAVNEMMVDCSA